MTIESIEQQINDLQKQLELAKRTLIKSVTAEAKGRYTTLTTADGTKYVTQTQSDSNMNRSVWNEDRTVCINANVRSSLSDVKLFVARLKN
jgi:hypothetical protein